MCDRRALRRMADRHNLRIVEDSAHCVEGARDGIRPGDLSDAACFSFYATKSITCGEGGAVVTDDDDLAASLRLLRLHGVTKTAADRQREGYQEWDTVVLGWKYNLSNIEAAMLLPQLERIDEAWQRRETLAARYEERLRGVPVVSLPTTRSGVRHARHLFTVWIAGGRRDAVLRELRVDPSTREIPVVILSADVMPGHAERLRESGAHAFLGKPLDVRELLALVDEFMPPGES